MLLHAALHATTITHETTGSGLLHIGSFAGRQQSSRSSLTGCKEADIVCDMVNRPRMQLLELVESLRTSQQAPLCQRATLPDQQLARTCLHIPGTVTCLQVLPLLLPQQMLALWIYQQCCRQWQCGVMGSPSTPYQVLPRVGIWLPGLPHQAPCHRYRTPPDAIHGGIDCLVQRAVHASTHRCTACAASQAHRQSGPVRELCKGACVNTWMLYAV